MNTFVKYVTAQNQIIYIATAHIVTVKEAGLNQCIVETIDGRLFEVPCSADVLIQKIVTK